MESFKDRVARIEKELGRTLTTEEWNAEFDRHGEELQRALAPLHKRTLKAALKEE